MGTSCAYKSVVTMAVMILIISCQESAIPPAQPEDRLSDIERSMAITWKYDSIIIDDLYGYSYANGENIPGCESSNYVPITNRYIKYDWNFSYQLLWDPIQEWNRYGLGVNEEWQPNVGYWRLNEAGDSLIHNSSQYYEKKYKIVELSEDRFVRSSFRKLTGDIPGPDCLTTQWAAGSTVKFTEVFVPKN